jgi:hypothetical protein
MVEKASGHKYSVTVNIIQKQKLSNKMAMAKAK